MSNAKLWCCVSANGTTLTAVRREIHDSRRRPADGPVYLELRIMNGYDLHRSETFHTEDDLRHQSEKLRQLLIQLGWHQPS